MENGWLPKISHALSVIVGLAVVLLIAGYHYYEGYLSPFGSSWVVDRVPRFALIKAGFLCFKSFMLSAVAAAFFWIILGGLIKWSLRRSFVFLVIVISGTTCFVLGLTLPIVLQDAPLINNGLYSDIVIQSCGVFFSSTVAIALLQKKMPDDETHMFRVFDRISTVPEKVLLIFLLAVIICSIFPYATTMCGLKDAAKHIRKGGFPRIHFPHENGTVSKAEFLLALENSYLGLYSQTVSPESLETTAVLVTSNLVEVSNDSVTSFTKDHRLVHEWPREAIKARMRIVQ